MSAEHASHLLDFEKLDDSVFSAVPYDNVHKQLPERQAEHEAWLKEHNASVCTRFPPEPNGYLHIGHAKAMFLDFGYAKKRGGITYLRFDDTNPDVEEQEFIDNIIEDVNWLGHTPWKITHTSDYFDKLYAFALRLIDEGKCYVDDLSSEEVKEYRRLKMNSPSRDRSIEDNKKLFHLMSIGYFPEGKYTLRLKIDMSDPNTTMRDPIAYRVKYCPHANAGNKYCVYPSYDFSHSVIDSLENITHSLCTLEFNVRQPIYQYMTKTLSLYNPMQWEFGKLFIENSVTSKRRINALVRNGILNGFDDPRLCTLKGLRRRGYTPEILNSFIAKCGISRNDKQTMSYNTLENQARTILDPKIDRCFVVIDPLKIILDDYNDSTMVECPIHPKYSDFGKRLQRLSNIIYISSNDWRDEDQKKYFGLAPGKSVGLKYGPNIKCISVDRDENGKLIAIHCVTDWDRSEVCKGQIHWLSPVEGEEKPHEAEIRLYDQLLIGEYDPDNFMSQINPNSLVIKKGFVSDNVLEMPAEHHFQAERLGYFVCDRFDHVAGKTAVLNRLCTLRESKEKKEL